jgi:hypothetical protein
VSPTSQIGMENDPVETDKEHRFRQQIQSRNDWRVYVHARTWPNPPGILVLVLPALQDSA